MKTITRNTLISVGVIVLLITSYLLYQSQTSSIPILEVVDDRIIDVTINQEVKLRGLTLWSNDWVYGFGDREPYAESGTYMPLTQAHFDQMKRWGVNLVKLETWWTANHNFESGLGFGSPSEPLETSPQVYNEAGLIKFTELIRMAHEADLFVMISVRVCFNPELAASGEQPWWGWSTHDYVVFNQEDAAGQRGLTRFCLFLEWLVSNVSEEPNVVAIEPWHFPYHAQTPDSERVDRYFEEVVPAMLTAVRKHTEKIFVVSPPGLGNFNYTQHPGPLNASNIVYATGGYGSHRISYRPDAPAWDYETITEPNPSWRKFRDKYNVVIIGTEGPGIAQHRFPRPLPQDRLDLFDTVLSIHDELWGWVLWQYSGPSCEFGILESNDPDDLASEGQLVNIVKQHLIEE